jgi:hypothetical protein
MPTFRARKTIRLGPIRLNFTQNGFSSWGLKIGPWSWNAKTGRHTLDTPGPGSLHTRGRRRR